MYQNVFDFSGKVVLCAGGYGGIGAEASKAFAECGASVVIVGRSQEKADALASKLKIEGLNAEGIGCDCTNEADIAEMVTAVTKKHEHIDVLVNFLGGNVRIDADKYDLTNWNKIIDLNLTSCMLLCREIGKTMIRQQKGKIVLLGSVRSELGLSKEYTAYCAAKGGVKMYGRCLAAEWAKYGINVNVVAPTFVPTEQVADMLKDQNFLNSLLNRIPLKRLASTTDVANAVLFFSSAASDFITGQILLVDGGITSTQ